MDLPGPPGGLWGLGLLLWAAAIAVLGEAVRLTASRWFPTWRTTEPLERGLLDLYLGGATLYLVAALPFGLFVPPLVDGLPIAGALVLIVRLALARRRGYDGGVVVRSLAALARPSYLVALGSALALYVLELAVALPIGTGNTFDSGLLTTYTALLLQHHSIPLSFQPYAAPGILYPQGTTVWLGGAQGTFGLPPARTSLLVTPLFLALAPLAGFAFGRRAFGSDRGGAALALALAWLAPATRGLVAGSNDFVFAFPLVLLLGGEVVGWVRSYPPSVLALVGFGLLAGYSAALNPVGAEWLFLALLLGGLAQRPLKLKPLVGRLGRWAAGAATALIGVIPSIYVLLEGRSNPGFVPGAAAPPAGTPAGIPLSQFVGDLDPFLFRPQDVALSPVPALRLELAILIVVGVGILVAVPSGSALAGYLGRFRRFAAVSGLALVALLGLEALAYVGVGPAAVVARLTSAGELSTWLFAIYVFIAMVPLVLALERFAGWVDRIPPARRSTSTTDRTVPSRRPVPFAPGPAVLALGVALVIVAPGLALTPTAFPPVLSTIYRDLGNVSAGDFALLEYAGAHLPVGSRVLIAPGSAADFLPGYASDLVLLYPLIPGWAWVNRSYHLVVNELSNRTLDASGLAAMAALDVGYVVVTGNNTVLWPAFSPAPLLAEPADFTVLFHQADAYLFERTGG